MDDKETPNKLELPDDDYVVFIPDKDLRSIEQALNKMEQAQQELHKIRESLNNGELRVENGE
jgi:predicted RNA-binding protein